MKNNKGFTLIELLTALVILGIITGMSFPILTAIKNRNEKKKYDTYEATLISAAKLYVDSYKDDFKDDLKRQGYFEIKYQMLERKKLVKDINLTDVTCNTDGTSVFVIADENNENKYTYRCKLRCVQKSDQNINIYKKNDYKGKDFNRSKDNIEPRVDDVSIESENEYVESRYLKINMTASDVYNEDNQDNSQLSFCVALDSNTCKNGGRFYMMNYDSEADAIQDGENIKLKKYKLNDYTYDTKHAYDGSKINIYITVKDAADNYISIEPIPYQIHLCKKKNEEVDYGDVDGNGYINEKDYNRILRYTVHMINLDEDELAAGDVNLDGDTDTYDVTIMQRYLLAMIPVLPWPYNYTNMELGNQERAICENS